MVEEALTQTLPPARTYKGAFLLRQGGWREEGRGGRGRKSHDPVSSCVSLSRPDNSVALPLTRRAACLGRPPPH